MNYIIKSRKNENIIKYKKLIRDKKDRQETGSFICEGLKLSHEALICGLVPKSALFTKSAAEKYSVFFEKVERACKITIISDDLGSFISDTKTPQGIFLEFSLLNVQNTTDFCLTASARTVSSDTGLQNMNHCSALIILDSLQDAGNMGAIIRAADAFGMDAVIFSPDCPDIHSAKVIRSSMGSVFRVPLISYELRDIIKMLKQSGFLICASLLDKNAGRLDDIKIADKIAIIIGNEGQGISPLISDLADKKVYIPIKNAQSLNAAVAASVIMWEVAKSRREL